MSTAAQKDLAAVGSATPTIQVLKWGLKFRKNKKKQLSKNIFLCDVILKLSLNTITFVRPSLGAKMGLKGKILKFMSDISKDASFRHFS